MRLLVTAVVLTAVLTGAVLLVSGGSDDRRASVTRTVPQALPPSASTERQLTNLRATVAAAPLRPDGWTLLSAAELQRGRETGDASSYVRAQRAVDRALALKPGDQAALTQRAALALSRHDFRDGLRDALAAHAQDPTVLKPYGPLVDADVELGRYADAERAAQAMVDRKPDLAALTRVSYLRELRGDRGGALSALRAALSAGGQIPENTAFVSALLGTLELQVGHLDRAARAARQGLHDFPGHPASEVVLAKVDAARGQLPRAITRLRRLTERLPLPEHVTLLAELELSAGRPRAARADLALVRAERRLQVAAGVVVDVEAALLDADHGDAAAGVALARRAWAAAPSVRSADALGWALTRSGDPWRGLAWARRALARGWRDPLPRLHAGIAAARAGQRAAARRWLRQAVAGAAALGPWQAARARAALATVGGRAA